MERRCCHEIIIQIHSPRLDCQSETANNDEGVKRNKKYAFLEATGISKQEDGERQDHEVQTRRSNRVEFYLLKVLNAIVLFFSNVHFKL